MNDLPIYFVSGLPRSGSTLLMNILGQCPNHHVTPTNDLIELIVSIRNTWQNHISFRTQGLSEVQPRIENSMKGMMYGFFEQEFNEGKYIFDKSRGWIAYIELLEEILKRPVKVIVTVRDMKSILASFEMIHRQSQVTKPSPTNDAFFDVQSIEGRCKQLLNIQSVVGLSVTRFRDALNRGLADRLIIIPYKELTQNTQNIMNQLHDNLGIERYNYQLDHINQITEENDDEHGMSLHQISNQLQYKTYDHSQILTQGVCDWIDRDYADINNIAGEN